MKLFVGLGNPGPKYASNRHNVGFMALDRIAEDHGFGPWRAKYQGQLGEGSLGGEKVILLKPETFMNNSGQSVGETMRFYKLAPSDIIVFHDEIDLAPGKLRVKQGGGHAGHNGLRSLHSHISDAYHRVRIGVGHPGHKDAVPHFVLKDFSKADQEWLLPMLDGIADGATDLAKGDAGRFQNAVALRIKPPRKKSEADDKSAKSGTKSPAAAPAEPPTDGRSALQKLVDKFR